MWHTDALALRLAEDAYYFLGQSLAIRDCAARVLPAWDRDNPLTSFVLGLYAFGLEEAGDLKRAEDVGRDPLERNPRDAWATHALAHVMETANRQEEGVAFLKSTRATWERAHFMAEMAPLAVRGAANRRFGRAERVDHLRMIAAKAADHVKHGDGDAAQNEGRVAREGRLEGAERIPGQAVVVGEARSNASAEASEPASVNPCWSLAIRRFPRTSTSTAVTPT